MYVCMYVHTYIHTYICTYVCMYVCMYIHTYIHTYICTYIPCLQSVEQCSYLSAYNTALHCIDTALAHRNVFNSAALTAITINKHISSTSVCVCPCMHLHLHIDNTWHLRLLWSSNEGQLHKAPLLTFWTRPAATWLHFVDVSDPLITPAQLMRPGVLA